MDRLVSYGKATREAACFKALRPNDFCSFVPCGILSSCRPLVSSGLPLCRRGNQPRGNEVQRVPTPYSQKVSKFEKVNKQSLWLLGVDSNDEDVESLFPGTPSTVLCI